MNLYEKKFLNLLEADDAEQDTVKTDAQAMAQELEPGTNPAEFNISAPPVDQTRNSHNEAQKQELTTWIGEIEKFINYLNGTDGNSIQTKLHSGSCDTMFEKIASSDSKRIARVAMELGSLVQSLKGYLISNND